MTTTPADIERLSQAVVAETRRIQAVERALRPWNAPRRIGDHSAEAVAAWLEEHRTRLDDLYVALCNAWLETGR